MFESAAYPLDVELSDSVLIDRLNRFNADLHAVRVWRPPKPHVTYRVLVKDNIGMQDFTTTAGSKALENLRLPDAACICRLRNHTEIDLFGKTNLSELANFVTTALKDRSYSELGGMVNNPHGSFATGGSSSGSAVAVAAGFCDAALGTETRGSLMMPAMHCAVWALKPTRASVSTDGVIPLSSTFDTVGVMARNPDTLKAIWNGIREPSFQSDKHLYEFASEKPELCVLRTAAIEYQSLEEAILTKLAKTGFPISVKTIQPIDFHYKTISTRDFRLDMDRFLKTYATTGVPHSFEAFFRYYQDHPQSRPFGMDRLQGAADVDITVGQAEFQRLKSHAVQSAADFLLNLLNHSQLPRIALCFTYYDFWAISGYPSLAIPIQTTVGEPPRGLMLGGLYGSEEMLIEVGRIIGKVINHRSVVDR